MPERLSRGALGWIGACGVLGALSLSLAASSLPDAWRRPDAVVVLAGGFLVLAGVFVLQARSPSLSWRGHRLALHPDEALLLVAFYALPPGVVVLAAVAAALSTQVHQQRAPLKAAFNVSAQAGAVGAAAVAHAYALGAGLPPLAAAALVPVVVSAANQALVAILLTLLARAPLRAAWTPSLVTSIALASTSGVLLGSLTIALFQVHWLAPTVLAPIAYFAHAAIAAEVRHENEMAVRRSLQRVHAMLADEEGEEEILLAVRDACREAFPVREARVRLFDARGGERSWRWTMPLDASARVREVRAELPGPRGQPMGEIVLLARWRGRRQAREDEGLLALVAAQLANVLRARDATLHAREAEAKTRGVFNAIRDPVLVWTPEGRVAHSNAAAARLLGGRGASGARADLAGVLEPDGFDRLQAWCAARPAPTGVVHAATRGPGRRELEIDLGPIALDGGREGILAIARDVTEKRALEREAEAHREAAARNDRLVALGTLVAGVAHEVNNPLFYMQGHVELAMLDLDDALAATEGPAAEALRDAREKMGAVLGGVDRIGRISRGLGEIARRPGAVSASADANAAVERAGQELSAALPAGATLRVDVAPSAVCVRADPEDLRRLVLHLGRNAVEAIGPGGHVEIRCALRGARVELSVADSGPGIPREERARLFVPFHTTKPDAVGLGLAAAHAIARNLGGDVRVQSEAGEGSTFTVDLPLAAEAPPPQAR